MNRPVEAAETSPHHEDKPRILIVDDDASVREMLTRILAGEGYQVWAASNGTAVAPSGPARPAVKEGRPASWLISPLNWPTSGVRP